MDLQELVAVLRRRWAVFVGLTLIGALSALAFTAVQEREYTATATVLVQPASGQSTNDLNSGATLVERVVQTYAALAVTPVVLEPAAQTLGLTSGAELRGAVSTAISSGTTFVTISVKSSSPEFAAEAANVIGDELARAVADIAPKQSGQAAIVLDTITPAVPPSSPSSPDLVTNVLVGTLAGLLLGAGYITVREAFDTRVRTGTDVRRVTSAPLLGVVTAEAGRRHGRDRTGPGVAPELAEDFRRIRTNLHLSDPKGHVGVLVVTACTSEEGRALFAVNLAQSAMESGLKVCLVEADLRGHELRQALGLREGPGLADVLQGNAKLGSAIQRVNGIEVIHAGQSPSQHDDLVTSLAMTSLLRELDQMYDLVICAAAPLLETVDAAALGTFADGVVLVVRSKRVRRTQLSDAVTALDVAGARLLGVVLNEDAATSLSSPALTRAEQPASRVS